MGFKKSFFTTGRQSGWPEFKINLFSGFKTICQISSIDMNTFVLKLGLRWKVCGYLQERSQKRLVIANTNVIAPHLLNCLIILKLKDD